MKEYKPILPSPSRLKSMMRERKDEETMDTFHKVEINILLVYVIKQILGYAMFLRELFVSKKILKIMKQ